MRTDVALLCGGHRSEHEVSLKSGRALMEALMLAGYGVHPVVVGEDGTWSLLERRFFGDVVQLPSSSPGAVPAARLSGRPLIVANALAGYGVRVVVLGLHGRFGEDGSIQGFLQTAGFSWTGCDVTSSALAMDKLQFKRALRGAGLPTPAFREIMAGPGASAEIEAAIQALGAPLVVKAPALGSSVSVHVAADAEEARSAASQVLVLEGRALMESFVAGTELTVPVLGRGPRARPLPVIEIRPRKAAFFDYVSKYEAGGADEIVPARISGALSSQVSSLALRIHRLIGARGVTRTDFLISERGEPLVLEINTLPGMTEASLVPKSAAAAGITMPKLVRTLVEEAAQRPSPVMVPEAAHVAGG